MSKFSVKKPFTVFVAVIAVIVLGVVAYLKMTPDLLPNMNFPYVMIMTTYPGASPEKVEQEVTKPLEQSMSTLEHIKEVTSTSAENYSMVLLEFEESVNLDTVGVDIQQSITALQGSWDEMIGAPYVLKINPSVLPVQVAAVSMKGMDTIELTQLLNDSLMNKLEGIVGVARVSTSGTVSQQIHVVIDQQKLDKLNETLTKQINGKMDEALSQIADAEYEIKVAQNQLDKGKEQLDKGKQELIDQTTAGSAEVTYQLNQLVATRAQLETTLTALKAIASGLETLQQQTGQTQEQLDNLQDLSQQLKQLETLKKDFEEQISQIQGSGNTQEEIQAAIDALKANPEYVQWAAAWAELEAKLAALNLTADSLAERIKLLTETLDSLTQKAQELLKLLDKENISPEALNGKIKELEEGLQQVDAGIQMLKDTQKTLDAAKMSGLLEISNAATEMAVGKSTLEAAKLQIEEGKKTLEDTREKTLQQADVNQILTMDMVANILVAQNFSMPAGTIQDAGVSYMVSIGEELTDLSQLQELLLFDMGMEGVAPIYLSDVANVMLTDNRNETYAKLNQLDCVVLNFEKQSTYATAEVTDSINQRFRQLEKEYEGLKFVSLMNQGDYIYMIVETILSSLLLGALFAIIILFVFLRDLRPTFITLCSIPISVIFAIVLMYFSGVTINIISLSGLAVAVGMLVDNSVVVIENVYRLRAKGANAVQAAVSGAQQVAGAVTASTLTTVCVFVPIVFVEGITRQLFVDLALTMTYALVASLVVALTLVPAMAAGLLKKEKKNTATMPGWFMRGYEKAVAWSLDHKAIVLIAAVVLLAGSAIWSLSRGFIFMPKMDMPNITVSVTMPEEATMEEKVALADQVLERIEGLEGIETTGAMMGGDVLGGLTGGGGEVTVYVILSDQNASGAAVAKRIETVCAGMECTVSASSAMLDMSMLSGSGISLEIYSDNMQVLQEGARAAAAVLEDLEGVKTVSDGLGDTTPALQIRVDRNKAMAKGITVAQIYMELAEALRSSTTATSIMITGKSTDVIVEKPEEAALTLEELKNYPFEVTTQTGQVNEFVLSDVAELEETTSLMSIVRKAQRRYVTVSAELEEGYNVTLVTAEAEKLMKKADLGENVTYEFSGENETIMEAVEQLGLMLLLGIVLVYLVMVAQFQSLKSPFIVMFTIPLAFTGGFFALVICGMEVSVISLVGFVMLTGIIVNNGIVLVDYVNQLRAEGKARREALIEAGSTRIRPILMTTVTTILGLLDMAIRVNVGTAMMRPMAVVCIGGLLYATLMTLFVVPCIYDMLNKKELRIVNKEDLEILDI